MNTSKSKWYWLGAICLPAIALRLWLTEYYYGWEESDYGNLAMIYGVWESGFTHYDMNHMPGYYFFSAVFYGIFQDSIFAGKIVSLISGLVVFLSAILIVRHVSNEKYGLLVGLFLLLQPELMLYSTSALREPLYGMFILGSVWGMLRKSPLFFGICGVLAFSVRFEAPLFLLPMGWFVFTNWRHRARALLPVVFGILGWMLYCWFTYETWAFWSHAAAVNVETGLGQEATKNLDWVWNGITVCFGLMTSVLPNHIGWFVVLGWLFTPIQWSSSKRVMQLWLWSCLMVFVWLAIAFVAQHEVGHNLYWKWMLPFVPLLAMTSALTWGRWLPKWAIVVGVIYTLLVQGVEGHRQFQLSKSLFQPQVELARWVEDNVSTNEALIFDNVPACWVRRKESNLDLFSWFDVPMFLTPEHMIEWAKSHNVKYVLYFEEEWTQAPVKAKFLESIQSSIIINNAEIVLLRSEKQYGWRWFELRY